LRVHRAPAANSSGAIRLQSRSAPSPLHESLSDSSLHAQPRAATSAWSRASSSRPQHTVLQDAERAQVGQTLGRLAHDVQQQRVALASPRLPRAASRACRRARAAANAKGHRSHDARVATRRRVQQRLDAQQLELLVCRLVHRHLAVAPDTAQRAFAQPLHQLGQVAGLLERGRPRAERKRARISGSTSAARSRLVTWRRPNARNVHAYLSLTIACPFRLPACPPCSAASQSARREVLQLAGW
jgi:hypothetical protein